METTFITIHDLSKEARILYASDSVIDILGYSPEEVINRSAWDFFHKDEIPLAQAKHDIGVQMDKAAVLSYCSLKDRDGNWLGCEVVFTVVFDVMVGCISIYRRGLKSRSRAAYAPIVRRMFSSSPRDPRYHMLSHLSAKFTLPPLIGAHEPRAALFLNRYTRTLTVMYATDGLADILGISGDEMRGRSFYHCIEENCLQEAVRCLENAKANDSIAYLRFWYRDPRLGQGANHRRQFQQDRNGDEPMGDADTERGEDVDMDNTSESLASQHGLREQSHDTIDSQAVSSSDGVESPDGARTAESQPHVSDTSRTSSGRSSVPFNHEAVFSDDEQRYSSSSSMSNSPLEAPRPFRRTNDLRARIELEAVVSCTSDGLVVCMRRARPLVEHLPRRGKTTYTNGLFAVPWATDPIIPPPQQRPRYVPRSPIPSGVPPAIMQHSPAIQTAIPGQDDLMSAIREIAVFAWALTGINGSLAEYGRGQPRGEALPASGLPIWQPGMDVQNSRPSSQASPNTIPADFASSAVTPDEFSGSNIAPHWPRTMSGDSDVMVDASGQVFDGDNRDGVDGTSQSDRFMGDGERKRKWFGEKRGSSAAMVDGDGQSPDSTDRDDYHRRRYTSASSTDGGASESPISSRLYHLVPMVDGLGHMVDGFDNAPPQGKEGLEHAAEMRSMAAWSSPSAVQDAMHGQHNTPSTDGVARSRKSPSDPYGFGDPGLSSKAKLYNAGLIQELKPQSDHQPDQSMDGQYRAS